MAENITYSSFLPTPRVAMLRRAYKKAVRRESPMPAGFASTPEPPYYAVIFTSQRTAGDHGYEATAQAMFELALKQPGCLGAESVRGDNGLGITVGYFTDEPAIRAWKHWWPNASARSAGIRTMSCGSPKWSGPIRDRRGGEIGQVFRNRQQ